MKSNNKITLNSDINNFDKVVSSCERFSIKKKENDQNMQHMPRFDSNILY